MKWQDISKLLASCGSIGVIGLFAYLFLLTGLSYEHTGNSFCKGLDCEAYINVTTSYWNFGFENTDLKQKVYVPYNQINGGTNVKLTAFIYEEIPESKRPILYKKATYGRKLWINLDKIDKVIKTEPEVQIEWLVPTYGNKWRVIRSGDTWERNKINKIKITAHLSNTTNIKWSFILDDKIDIDPFIVSYIDNYKTQYQTKIRFVELITGKRTDKIYNNFTKQIEYRTVDVINVEQVKYKEPYLKKQGLIVGEKTYLNSFIKDDKLIIFNIPIGDRNLEKFGYCREYEKQKGVCYEIDIKKDIMKLI